MSVFRYAVARIVQFLPATLVVVLITFLLIHAAPGDAVALLAGESGADPAYYEMMRDRLGLDRPMVGQFVGYLSLLATGDLGRSHISRAPVATLIGERVPATLLLGLSAVALATLLGILLGAVAAVHAGRSWDHLIIVLTLVGFAAPVFWVGQILIIVFSLQLAWFPVGGMISFGEGGADGKALDVLWHLVLPVLTLSIPQFAVVARTTRSALLNVIHKDYVRTAKSKGLPRVRIWVKHALRNAMLPVLTVIGTNIALLASGTVLVELIFGWPGVGRLLYDAVLQRDYPLITGIFLLVSLFVLAVNLIIDLLYPVVDPRVAYD